MMISFYQKNRKRDRIWKAAHQRCRFLREALTIAAINRPIYQKQPLLNAMRTCWENLHGPQWMSDSTKILIRLIDRDIQKINQDIAKIGWGESMSTWIATEDQKPPENTPLLALYKIYYEYKSDPDYAQSVMIYSSQCKEWKGGHGNHWVSEECVTHWMPLPSPPLPTSRDDINRCAVCGWSLAQNAINGCVRGNCSQRPRPERLYNAARAFEESRIASLPAVDRSNRTTLSGRPPEPGVHLGAPAPLEPETGTHRDYWVLSQEERAKGFVRPVRRTYTHSTCGHCTTMGDALAETYARDPKFYTATFCVFCKMHYPVNEFVWTMSEEKVGS